MFQHKKQQMTATNHSKRTGTDVKLSLTNPCRRIHPQTLASHNI